MSRTLDLTLRVLLWLLFLAAAAHAVFILWYGLAYPLPPWDAENLSPTMHWLAALALPIVLFKMIPRRSINLSRTALITVGAWAFVGYYVLFYVGYGAAFRCNFRWFC